MDCGEFARLVPAALARCFLFCPEMQLQRWTVQKWLARNCHVRIILEVKNANHYHDRANHAEAYEHFKNSFGAFGLYCIGFRPSTDFILVDVVDEERKLKLVDQQTKADQRNLKGDHV